MRNFAVSRGSGDYRLHLEEIPTFWDVMATFANRVCVLTRHRWCYRVCGPVDTRLHRATREVAVLDLTEAQARAIDPGLVTIFDEEEDD